MLYFSFRESSRHKHKCPLKTLALIEAKKFVTENLFGDKFCLCWGLTSQSTIFQSCRDGATASWVINQYIRGVKCFAQGHNTAAVGIEPPTSRSGVRHSTTEPPRSASLEIKKNGQIRGMVSSSMLILFYTIQVIPNIWTGRGSSIGSEFAWHVNGLRFNSHVRHILSWRLGHENISTAILPLPLIQEEQLSVSGKRMCTKYW